MVKRSITELGLERKARSAMYSVGLSDRQAGGRWPRHLKLARNAEGMISAKEASVLYHLARSTRQGCIVEVGSYRGRSAIALALGSSAGAGVPVMCVEPHEAFTGVSGLTFGADDRGAFYRNMLRSKSYRRVRLLNVSSEVLAPGWNRPVGLLWLDGDHTYDGVRRDFECFRPHFTADAKVAFDDALNPTLGPARLIKELTGDGVLRQITTVGKIAVFAVLS